MNLLTAKMRPITRVRSSALMAADRCATRALLRYSLGIIPPGDDLTQQGTNIHDLAEQWSKYGTDPSESAKKLPGIKPKDAERLARITRSLLRNIPKPPINPALVEHKYEDRTTYPGFTYHGTIDLVHPEWRGNALVITDHKSTSSFLWFLSEADRNTLSTIAKTRITSGDSLAVYYEMRKIAEEEMTDWHAHAEAYMRTSIQARAYTAEADRATGHTGPIVFRWNIVQRREPYDSRVVETVFTHADRVAARKDIHARMRLLHSYSLRDNVSLVPFNLGACDDYKSHRNPLGCKFRAHCAALGRPTMGEFSRLIHSAQQGKEMNLDDMLSTALGSDDDPLGLTTETADQQDAREAVANDPLGLSMSPGEEEYLADRRALDDPLGLATQVTNTLTPGMRTVQQFDPAWTDESLLSMDRSEIEELRMITLATKAPVQQLAKEDVHAAIVYFMPHLTIAQLQAAPYTDEQLQRTLTSARATASTAKGEINPPDGPPAKSPPPPLSSGKKGKTGEKGNARGQSMPAAYGGDLVGRTNKPTILKWLADHGHAPTVGTRYSNKLAQIFVARRIAELPFDPNHKDDRDSRITPAGTNAPAIVISPSPSSKSAFAINPSHWPHSATVVAGSGTSEDRSIITQQIVSKRPDIAVAKLIGMDLRGLLSVYEQYCTETVNVRTSNDREEVIALILGHRKDLSDADLANYTDEQLIAYLAQLNEEKASERGSHPSGIANEIARSQAANHPSGIANEIVEQIRALCEMHSISMHEIGTTLVISK